MYSVRTMQDIEICKVYRISKVIGIYKVIGIGKVIGICKVKKSARLYRRDPSINYTIHVKT